MDDLPPGQAATGEMPAYDLTTCDREPIHALGAIQPFGLLIAVTSDWIVARVSANSEAFLGAPPEALLGQPLVDILLPGTIHAARGMLQALRGEDAVERLYGLPLIEGGAPHDLAVHLASGMILIEAEPCEEETLDAGAAVRSLTQRLQRTGGTEAFEREAVRGLRALTGFDRVMLYRFDHDGSGEVVAESLRGDLEPYKGLRYPASDIPKQARALYLRNPLRLIFDTADPGTAVLPQRGPDGAPLDLSMSVLRAVSPIHLEYLTNMGVRASMSVSVIVGGELWGLFACHHMTPRRIGLARRSAADLFGQMFSWVLEGRLRAEEADYEARARAAQDVLMSAVAAAGAPMDAIEEQLGDLSRTLGADGAALFAGGRTALRGSTPPREEVLTLARFLNAAPPGRAYASSELGGVHPPAQRYAEAAAGVLAVPISRQPRDYLMFFRREVARSVTWAGDPSKPVTAGPNGIRLNPRESFAAWREVVRGQCQPWSGADLRIAEALRVTLLDVVLRMTDAAAEERKAAQERQELLIAELNHRVRNILGLIRGLVAQSRPNAGSVADFAGVLGGRIEALARAHDQITTMDWGPGDLRALLEAEIGAYLGGPAERVRLAGPRIALQPQAFSTVALVVHELTTNAMKYGALSDRSGRIDVTWSHDALGRLVIDWRETGGPAVQAPPRRGFGSTIIERSIPYDLKGEAEIRFALTGLEARFAIPAHLLAETEEAAPSPEVAPTQAAQISGEVLVVEDNMLIALDAEDMLCEIGASGTRSAASVAEALAEIEAAPPDAALLDVNLGAETSLPVAEALDARGIPFIFATGYGAAAPGAFAGRVPAVSKPYTADQLRAAFAGLAGG